MNVADPLNLGLGSIALLSGAETRSISAENSTARAVSQPAAHSRALAEMRSIHRKL